MFALVDCNNFYASCEEVFNPKLKNKPVIILSNNDGCVIARSKKAKEMKVQMGDPLFKYKDMIESNKIHVFSSNFTLYGDMSARVMKTLRSFEYPIEIYSIDEAFLYLKNIIYLEKIAVSIKNRVKKWTGLPVSVGVAKTKTLAKLANEKAKKTDGICILDDQIKIDDLLEETDVEDIWGIGRKLSKKLKKNYIFTAKDFINADEIFIKKLLSINGYKTILELKGIKCLHLEDMPNTRKSICTSRSFKTKIEDYETLSQAVSEFASIASVNLRKEKLKARYISVFITTSYHSSDPLYFNNIGISLPLYTSYSPDIITYSKKALKKIYKKGFLYKKAGVVLSDFVPEDFQEMDMFEKASSKNTQKLMQAMDIINYKKNKNAVFFAASGIDKKYKSLSSKRSKNFTTKWSDIIIVK